MRRLIGVMALCFVTFPALCQSSSKWQIAMITEVKPRQRARDTARRDLRFEQFLRGAQHDEIVEREAIGAARPDFRNDVLGLDQAEDHAAR